jgi:hypothetical protein
MSTAVGVPRNLSMATTSFALPVYLPGLGTGRVPAVRGPETDPQQKLLGNQLKD